MIDDHILVRQKFEKFLEKSGHKKIPPAPLALSGDSTTLFTSSGMQPLVPYLLGEEHPSGDKVYDIQPCIRTQDIEEVGDNRHTTFFEMMGNWSLGSYFKKEQIEQYFNFLTDHNDGIGLDPNKLFITIFNGDKSTQIKSFDSKKPLTEDTESKEIWAELFSKKNIDVTQPKRIFEYPAEKNWWSRSGVPSKMPIGEPGGPDSEVFYDFGANLMIHENSEFKNSECHPNCDCGRFMEIGNSVFMQYKKIDENLLEELPKKNVDFGGGLERLLAAINDDPDIFKTSLFSEIINEIEIFTNKKYSDKANQIPMRVIADHIKAATFLIIDGVRPSNKEHGYVLRRLLRRAAIKTYQLGAGLTPIFDQIVDRGVLNTYNQADGPDRFANRQIVFDVMRDEMNKFGKTLDKGLKQLEKTQNITEKMPFDYYQTYGFPLEITEELLKQRGFTINREKFYAEFEKHKNLSRTSSAGMFKGGLADQGEQTLKYHTATHLLNQALTDIVGNDVRQEGSNITGERLRFDFSSMKKPEKEDLEKVTATINEKIKESLPMRFKIMPKEEAQKIGAKSFFKEKYPDMVKVYYIGGEDDKPETAYSKEFCGGPHVTNTSQIGKIEIFKFEKIGSNMYRIYAK